MGAYKQYRLLSGQSCGLQGTVLWDKNVCSNNVQRKIIDLLENSFELKRNYILAFDIDFLADN